MSCNSNIIKTFLVVGKADTKIVTKIAEVPTFRVLHIINQASDIIAPEDNNYKVMNLSDMSRITYMALFLQYDFPVIIAQKDSLSDELLTVCKEQWDNEFDKHTLIEDTKKVDLSTDERVDFDLSQEIKNLTKVEVNFD